ncbi:MAG: ATP-binding cassette domain-containing protein [Candidatus Marinimicrobia bacterium]|nr:ATP-binding cassette domain-containing protein [Candidatus Neomarinimicrobiota bacterium]
MKILPFIYNISDTKELVNALEIDLSASSCTAIMGPVGSGKSLLIKLLSDSHLREINAFSEYPFCAYLSQDLTRLFTGNTPDSILELYKDKRYTVGQHFDPALFNHYAKKLEIDELMSKNRRLAHYSEGERQRLGLCLAAAVKAPVTILDEPTTALNMAYRQSMYELINEIRKRSRVFIISHRLLDCIAVADHVIRMENLTIAEHFPVEQIIEKDHILNYYSFENEVRNV